MHHSLSNQLSLLKIPILNSPVHRNHNRNIRTKRKQILRQSSHHIGQPPGLDKGKRLTGYDKNFHNIKLLTTG
jgi:hypothetical protein